MRAILFGSIGTIVETSELQRNAFNDAFTEHGLPWFWERDRYRDMLQTSGGTRRIADYAAEQGETIDAEAVHRSKSERYRESLALASLPPRPGVLDVIRDAKEHDVMLGLVTTTSSENVAALLRAAEGLGADEFAVVIDAGMVARRKPAADAYAEALRRLGLQADDCVAIEDNHDGLAAAVAAGIPCVAFPGANTQGHAYEHARSVTNELRPEDLRAIACPNAAKS